MSIFPFLVLFVLFLFSGCATMIHGKDQKVVVKTEPEGAQVTINGDEVGETPLTLTLPRKQDHVVNVSLDGYHGQTTHLKRKLAGTAILYLLPGGLLSLGIDSRTGAQYKLPESVILVLKPLFDPETVLASHMANFKAISEKMFIESESAQYQKLA